MGNQFALATTTPYCNVLVRDKHEDSKEVWTTVVIIGYANGVQVWQLQVRLYRKHLGLYTFAWYMQIIIHSLSQAKMTLGSYPLIKYNVRELLLIF